MQNSVVEVFEQISKFLSMLWIQVISADVEVRAQYSASKEERATMACFFAAYEIGMEPRKMQYHVVDL